MLNRVSPVDKSVDMKKKSQTGGNMSAAAEKKVFYNRVRRTCLLHDLEIVYDGVPKMYAGVDIRLKPDIIVACQYAKDSKPLNIDWKKLHGDLSAIGFTGGVK
mgnify:FL=1